MRSSQIIDSIFSEALGQLKRSWQADPAGLVPEGAEPPRNPEVPDRPEIPDPEALNTRSEAEPDTDASCADDAPTALPGDAEGGRIPEDGAEELSGAEAAELSGLAAVEGSAGVLDEFSAAQWRLAERGLPQLSGRADDAQTDDAAEYGQTIKENTVAAKKAKAPEDDRKADFPPELENNAEQEEDLDALLEDLANSTLPHEEDGKHDFINTDGFDPAGDEAAEEADELYTFGETAGGSLRAESAPDTSGHSLDDLLEHALGLNDVPEAEDGSESNPADAAADEAETNSALDELIGGLSGGNAEVDDLFGEDAQEDGQTDRDEDDLFGESSSGLEQTQDDSDNEIFANSADESEQDAGDDDIDSALAGLVSQIDEVEDAQEPSDEDAAFSDDSAEDSGMNGLAGMDGLDEIGPNGESDMFHRSGGSVEPALSDDLFGEGSEDAQDEDADVVRTIPVPEPSIPLTEDVDAELEKKLAEMGLGGDNLLHNRFSAEKEKLLRHLMDRFEALARRKLEPLSCEQVPLIRSVNLRVEIDLKFGEFVASGADDSLFSLDLGNGLSKA